MEFVFYTDKNMIMFYGTALHPKYYDKHFKNKNHFYLIVNHILYPKHTAKHIEVVQ